MTSDRRARPIASLRWWIGGLLFASTVINYIDRQTLSLLAPFLKGQYRWTNSDYADIVIAFRLAYSVGQAVFGRLLDRIGTRQGLTFTVIWYSLVSMLTSLSRGFLSFTTFRFLLGAGESANWPAATKAVSEWFPKKERAFATAFFDSGSSIGGAIAPFLILPIYFRWGWRPAFVLPGVLGSLWLIGWRVLYESPEKHSRISDEELQYILADKEEVKTQEGKSRPRWRDLFSLPQTWGVVISKLFTDPVWFFVTDWLPIYLVLKGINLRSSFTAIWIPFIAADLGNFLSGAFSGYLVKRGWSVGAARKALIVFGGIGVTALIPTIFTNNPYFIALLFGVATLSYASFSTMANVLPADVFHGESVASVSGLSGAAAGIATVIGFKAIGDVTDRRGLGVHSFDPIMIVAGVVPLIGMLLVLLLVRNTKATEQGRVKRI